MIDTQKIGTLLQDLTAAERIYLDHTLSLSQLIQQLEKKGIQKETIIERCGISAEDYPAFISGNWEYTVRHAAIINSLWEDLKIKTIKENPPIRVPKRKEPPTWNTVKEGDYLIFKDSYGRLSRTSKHLTIGKKYPIVEFYRTSDDRNTYMPVVEIRQDNDQLRSFSASTKLARHIRFEKAEET